jgi:GTPase SAR1 family protein
LARLTELERISLWNNRFNEIPEVVFRLENLTDLNLASYDWLVEAGSNGLVNEGSIKQVPADILQLPKLKTFDIEGHPIEVPPAEVVDKGVEAIKEYWRQRQEVGIDYLAEAKLIVVGEAGAGKTSLARKIEDSSYELKPQEESTEGIDVIRWGFPSAVRVKRDGREELHQTDFKASIWDFGGQEIYHATHQFFLTRRSLYVLVADDRKEDTDFNYWLQVVELHSDRSPLLIVQNEKQDRQRDIDLGSLRARFPNLREAFRVNLATNRGLDELERAIRQELEHLPHIGTPLPKTWSQVRTALENDPRNYISLEEFLDVCQENGFKRRDDKLQLSGYLHDLGICLHFQDDPVLKNTVILKPKWGTDAVYSVLDDHVVLGRRGQFGPEDLARIWAGETYSDMRDELLRLMMRFQLCYQVPGREVYIAPQLLSPTRPAYEWKGRNELVLRYDYEFMPKGILTRFIVAVNHLIADQSLVWKSGVLLARDGSRAEVIEDYPRRKIGVRVSGADARGLLAIVDDQLERIHGSFPRLKYEKFLPCNCEVCRNRDEPFAYPLSELRDFAAQGDVIQCRVSRKLVNAADLIRDVLPSAVYSLDELAGAPGAPRQVTHHLPAPPPVKEVFVSYAWDDQSTAIVEKLQEALRGSDIVLVRDKNEMRYKDSIRDFMQRIGRGKCVVVVLSKKYLESKNCMFEMTEVAGRGEIRDRVFPVVLDDAKIYDAIDRIWYLKYWEQKKEELDAAMKDVGGENLKGIREEIDLFAGIRSTIAEIVDILGDMNALTPERHRGSDFRQLLQAIEEKLRE